MKRLEAKDKDSMEGRFLCFIKEIKEYKGRGRAGWKGNGWRGKRIYLICEGAGMKK